MPEAAKIFVVIAGHRQISGHYNLREYLSPIFIKSIVKASPILEGDVIFEQSYTAMEISNSCASGEHK